jgi:hypothetical protein
LSLPARLWRVWRGSGLTLPVRVRSVPSAAVTGSVSGQERGVGIARDDVVGCPWVVVLGGLTAQPADFGVQAYLSCASLVVACVVRSFRFLMCLVVDPLAAVASTTYCGQVATVQAWLTYWHRYPFR